MQTDLPDTTALIPSTAPGRLRAQDWWRWVTLVPVLGTLAASAALVGRRRNGWAVLLLLLTITGAIAAALGFVKVHGSGFSLSGTPSANAYNDYLNSYGGLAGSGLNPFEYVLGRDLLVFAGLLWPLSIIVAWLAPNDFAAPPRRPWPEVTERAKRLSTRYGVAAYVICVGSVLGGLKVLNAAHVDPGVALGTLPIDAILLLGVLPLLLTRRLGFKDLGLRGTNAGKGAVLAISALFAYLILSYGYALIFASSTGVGPLSTPADLGFVPSGSTTVIDVLTIAVCVPVCEEIFFRGLLYRSLRNKMGIWPAALIAGCLFGLAHIESGYPLASIPVKMFFGVLMCLLYERTRSLLPTIAVHMFVDGTIAEVAFTGAADIALIATGAVLLAVVLKVIYNAIRDDRRDLAGRRPGRRIDGPSTPTPRRSPSTSGPVPA